MENNGRNIGTLCNGLEHQTGEIRAYRGWIITRLPGRIYEARIGNALSMRENSLVSLCARIDQTEA